MNDCSDVTNSLNQLENSIKNKGDVSSVCDNLLVQIVTQCQNINSAICAIGSDHQESQVFVKI